MFYTETKINNKNNTYYCSIYKMKEIQDKGMKWLKLEEFNPLETRGMLNIELFKKTKIKKQCASTA